MRGGGRASGPAGQRAGGWEEEPQRATTTHVQSIKASWMEGKKVRYGCRNLKQSSPPCAASSYCSTTELLALQQLLFAPHSPDRPEVIFMTSVEAMPSNWSHVTVWSPFHLSVACLGVLCEPDRTKNSTSWPHDSASAAPVPCPASMAKRLVSAHSSGNWLWAPRWSPSLSVVPCMMASNGMFSPKSAIHPMAPVRHAVLPLLADAGPAAAPATTVVQLSMFCRMTLVAYHSMHRGSERSTVP